MGIKYIEIFMLALSSLKNEKKIHAKFRQTLNDIKSNEKFTSILNDLKHDIRSIRIFIPR